LKSTFPYFLGKDIQYTLFTPHVGNGLPLDGGGAADVVA
jgi:hypothetical protein